jgi:hypothetical protein
MPPGGHAGLAGVAGPNYTRAVGLEEELDRLYALPLNEFIAARDELAKRLRAEGERDLADQVKSLRKPTVAVWLVNQLAREREVDVRRLLKAGEALGKAQATAKGFGEARRDEQEALGRLSSAARGSGVGPQAADRAIQTLRAASLTDEGRELLKRGRLTEELEPPGFEALAGMPTAPRRPKPKPPPRKNPQLKKAQERVKKLKAEAERATREATAAAERLAKAEAELERLEA